MVKYQFLHNKVFHVIKIAKGNAKLGGWVLSTYHFAVDQVISENMAFDKANCGNCPMSFNMNEGKSGGCYTHKGRYRWVLPKMLKDLNKQSIGVLDIVTLKEFLKVAKFCGVNLIRLGAYGEVTTLPIEVVRLFTKTGIAYTGYTHQWRDKPEFAKLLQASTHSPSEVMEANLLNFKVYNVGHIAGMTNCPGSAERRRILTCSACKLCNGKTKDIFIHKH